MLESILVPNLGTITLGQARLNIVEREDIALPLRVKDAYILFNGEVYNYIELREELRTLGWTFAGKTDSEVVLTAYLQWGAECLRRFNGMFALAIWDGTRFFCARDRMGKKPFFYRLRGNSFEFASEVKAFDNLEFVTHELFELFEFCFDEFTLYHDVLALRPAHYLIFEPTKGTCHTRSYWDIEEYVGRRIVDERQAVDTFIELLRDAVRLRLRADVPISLFLAGGLDSSLLAGLSGVKQAFTCQFEEFRGTIDEEPYVRDLAQHLGIDVQFVRPTRDEFLRDLPRLSRHLEMPTGSFSVFPLYRLAKACREAGYKVALTGEGSDEIFAGYARNELLLSETTQWPDAKRRHYAAMLRRYTGDGLDRFCRMASRSGLLGAALMRNFLSQHWSARRTTLQNLCHLETRVFLQPLLQMADRMCMAHGLENRCPYLDHRVVEFAFSLDDSLRYRDGVGKWIVHQAAQRVLPKGTLLLDRPVKHGLPTPVNQWLFGVPGFDRKHWNALLTAECLKSLLGRRGLDSSPHSMNMDDVPLLHKPSERVGIAT